MCPLESSQKRFCLFCARLSNEGHIEVIVFHQRELSSERVSGIRPLLPRIHREGNKLELRFESFVLLVMGNDIRDSTGRNEEQPSSAN